jgi:pilus assembly protein CpaB
MLKSGALGAKSNRVMLLLALFLGAVSAVLIVVYLSQSGGGDGGDSAQPALGTAPVVVAAQEIPAGTRVTAEMLTVSNLPTTAVLTGAFEAPDDIVGTVTRVPVTAGEQVISSKITGGDLALSEYGEDIPASVLIPDGMRAVSISVSKLTSAGGLIRAGDYVDIILTLSVEVLDDDGEEAGQNQVAGTILQNVQILALDQNVAETVIAEGADDTSVPSAAGDLKPDASTVTFVAAPVHAEVLALADLCRETFNGRITLSLRAFGDDAPVTTRTQYPADGQPPDCASLLNLNYLPLP